MLSGLFTGEVASLGTEAGITAGSTSVFSSGIQSFLNSQTNYSNTESAYLNWILLDEEQFKLVASGSGSASLMQATDGTCDNAGVLQVAGGINVEKNGYLCVYVSNTSTTYPVYFDQLHIEHNRGALLEENHYYPFGLAMSGIGSKAANSITNRYKYNGKEEQAGEFSDGSGLSMYDFGARMQDPQIGRWHAVDPLADDYFEYSPYNYVLNNPLSMIDPDGMGVNSTHTDSLGNVLAVFNDGDNGVYKHGAGTTSVDIEKAHSTSTSAGGTRMGETNYWDEFADHDSWGNINGLKTGNFADRSAKIHYGISADSYIENKIAYSARKINSFEYSMHAGQWLKENSARHHPLDIKDKIGAREGYLFKGKYTSGESLGNYLFGVNLETLRQSFSISFMMPRVDYFYYAAKIFGQYHNTSNGVKNPSVPPYYGEIPYSARSITLGYYNNNGDNPIMNAYGSRAIYGSVKIK